MSDIISVYAKSGVTIRPYRQVRLTGKRNGHAWEVDLPAAADQRTHAIALPAPKSINDTTPDIITDKKWGQARTFGPVVDVEVSGPVKLDDDLCSAADGRVYKARVRDKNQTGIALATKRAGEVCPVMLGWQRRR